MKQNYEEEIYQIFHTNDLDELRKIADAAKNIR